jgi:hypothetical protein
MWEPGETRLVVDDLTPLPLHRGGADAGAQARLAGYLAGFADKVLPLPDTPLPLFLHLHVQVPRETNVLHGYVLESFLAPLFGARRADGKRFSLVLGTKGTGTPSRLTLGLAAASSARQRPADCAAAPSSAPASRAWVEELRRALTRSVSVPFPEGPVHLALHIRCSPKQNWVALWKPALDALGPILGYDRADDPHRPRTDHLTRIEFHRQLDEGMGTGVEVEYRWTPVPIEEA